MNYYVVEVFQHILCFAETPFINQQPDSTECREFHGDFVYHTMIYIPSSVVEYVLPNADRKQN
jgi:hypothetical protein